MLYKLKKPDLSKIDQEKAIKAILKHDEKSSLIFFTSKLESS